MRCIIASQLFKHMTTFRPEKNVIAEDTYPKGYFDLFGSCKNLDLVEVDDIDVKQDGNIEKC